VSVNSSGRNAEGRPDLLVSPALSNATHDLALALGQKRVVRRGRFGRVKGRQYFRSLRADGVKPSHGAGDRLDEHLRRERFGQVAMSANLR